MDQSSATGTSSDVQADFNADMLKATAATYRAHKRIIDAASRYDNLDDAIAGLREAWGQLEVQSDKGSGYTPDRALGFGSDNAAVIADSLLGRRNGVSATRKAFNELGK